MHRKKRKGVQYKAPRGNGSLLVQADKGLALLVNVHLFRLEGVELFFDGELGARGGEKRR